MRSASKILDVPSSFSSPFLSWLTTFSSRWFSVKLDVGISMEYFHSGLLELFMTFEEKLPWGVQMSRRLFGFFLLVSGREMFRPLMNSTISFPIGSSSLILGDGSESSCWPALGSWCGVNSPETKTWPHFVSSRGNHLFMILRWCNNSLVLKVTLPRESSLARDFLLKSWMVTSVPWELDSVTSNSWFHSGCWVFLIVFVFTVSVLNEMTAYGSDLLKMSFFFNSFAWTRTSEDFPPANGVLFSWLFLSSGWIIFSCSATGLGTSCPAVKFVLAENEAESKISPESEFSKGAQICSICLFSIKVSVSILTLPLMSFLLLVLSDSSISNSVGGGRHTLRAALCEVSPPAVSAFICSFSLPRETFNWTFSSTAGRFLISCTLTSMRPKQSSESPAWLWSCWLCSDLATFSWSVYSTVFSTEYFSSLLIQLLTEVSVCWILAEFRMCLTACTPPCLLSIPSTFKSCSEPGSYGACSVSWLATPETKSGSQSES